MARNFTLSTDPKPRSWALMELTMRRRIPIEHRNKMEYLDGSLTGLVEQCPHVNGNHFIDLNFVAHGCMDVTAGVTHGLRDRFGRPGVAIHIGIGLVDRLDQFELLAAMAHELGHIVAAPFMGHDAEFTADAVSVQLTRLPQALIGCLEKLTTIHCPRCNRRLVDGKQSASHPSHEARVENIRRVATQLGLPC